MWGFFKELDAYKIIYRGIEAFSIDVGHFERFWGFLNTFSKKVEAFV
jgi:hypothetical protein